MPEPRIPMPGDRLGDKTVMVSCFYRDLSESDRVHLPADDDWPGVVYLVLLLNKFAPYFTVAHVKDNDEGTWTILVSESRFNIVEAVSDLYVQWGGDI